MASALENNQQNNFHPSWMKTVKNGGPVPMSRVIGDGTDDSEYPVAPPVFVENRYGREDLLALVGKDSRPPDGLQNCTVMFVQKHQPPISIRPLSEGEHRLQSNINSSKAMSSLTSSERAQVVVGANAISSPYASSPNRPASQQQAGVNSGGWTPVKSTWSRGSSTSTPNSGLRGGANTMGRGGFATTGRGGATTNTGQAGYTSNEDYGARMAGHRNGRGGIPNARGASTAASFNTRAQGLYGPRDPKERPRARLRSTSEEDVDNTPTTPSAPPANSWSRGGDTAVSSWGQQRQQSESGPLPEWMNDSDDDKAPQPRESSVENTGNTTKSFEGYSDRQSETWNPPPSESEVQKAPEPSPAPPPMFNSGIDPATAAQLAYNRMIGLSQTSTAPPPPSAPLKFYYLDPSKTERGPFDKEQMDAWFKMGYFEPTLDVRRSNDSNYLSLGELMSLNGQLTPFNYKEVVSPPPSQPQYPYNGGMPFSDAMKQGVLGGLWNGAHDMSQMPHMGGGYGGFNGPTRSEYDNALMIQRKRFEEESRQLLEETARIREMKEEMMREAERETLRRRELQAKEEALRNYQEEISRREKQIHETAKEMETRLEMERLQLEEKARQVERERQAALVIEKKKKEEEERMKRESEERERQKREEAERARREAEEKRKKEEDDRRIKLAEAAVEAERKKLELAAKQAAEQLKAKEEAERKRRLAEEEATMRAIRAAEEEEKNRIIVTEEWESVGKPKKADNRTLKAAPWSAPQTAREKTMKEILEEEEKQAFLERVRLEKLRKEELKQQSLASAGTWNNAAQRLALSAHQSAPVTKVTKKSTGLNAWGAPANEPPRHSSNPMFDGPSLVAANRVAVPQPQKKTVAAPTKQNQKKPAVSSNAQAFEKWAIQKMSNLNETVEADVLYSFIANIDDPNDVEDYMVGYLGETKAVKEFLKEFLKKRSLMRASGNNAVEDDLSASAGAGFQSVQTGKKKKGGKKLVVDGLCLGFTPAGDPNRTNKGEIETVGLMPGQRR